MSSYQPKTAATAKPRAGVGAGYGAARPPAVRAKAALPRPVGSFVPRLTRKALEKYGFSAAALITDWAQIVGPALANYTEPQRLKWPRGVDAYGESEAGATGRPGATLMLRVDPARALDIQYSGRQIIDRINGYFGYRAVAELRIIQTPLAELRSANPRDAVTARPATKGLGLKGPAPDLQAIPDERLRAALERLQRNMAGC